MTDPTEAGLRRELAAAFRLAALNGWGDHVATHMSARLPDGSYLMNPFGLLFEEITASSLVRVSPDGVLIGESPWMLNPAGINIHGGLLAGRADIASVMHLHTLDGVAVSALADGLLPLSQNALNIWSDVAYHAFEGVATAGEERARLLADLAGKHLLILRNHGTLTVGSSIASAFYRLSALEWACTAQIRSQSTGARLQLPAPEVIATMHSDWIDSFAEERYWPAMLRKAQRECPGFDS